MVSLAGQAVGLLAMSGEFRRGVLSTGPLARRWRRLYRLRVQGTRPKLRVDEMRRDAIDRVERLRREYEWS